MIIKLIEKWIKAALQDSLSERYCGWDNSKKIYDKYRRVIIVMENYVVVIALLKNIGSARFVTAYLADTSNEKGRFSTIDKIRKSPACEIKKPLICQAGSAEAFLNSATSGGEHS